MSFDSLIKDLPNNSSLKANILYNLSKLHENNREAYKNSVVAEKKNLFGDSDYLFYEELYTSEIENIHERMSYSKHDRVLRKGFKCKFCNSENTFSQDKQGGGGDEYIPEDVQCYNCNKRYKS